MAKQLTIGFAGTPEIAATVLRNILANGIQVKLVLTQMDRPAGRGMKLTPSAVKNLAVEHNIEVFQPEKLRGNLDALDKISAAHVDLWVVVAYGLIVPQEFLDSAPLGAVNIHVSLLPYLRGAAPIQRAILNGDSETGVTIMQMDRGLDTGDILYQKNCVITDTDTSASLHDKLAIMGSDMIVEFLGNHDKYILIKQNDSLSTYAAKLTKEEAAINWNDEAGVISRKVRGYNPYPIAHTKLNKVLLKIWQAQVISGTHHSKAGTILQVDDNQIIVACGNNTKLHITELQLAGSKRMFVRDFVVSRHDLVGCVLGE